MEQQPFYWEIKDILTQFVAAIDGCVVGRYDKGRDAKEQVKVRYVFAPKLRLMMDIVNQNSNATLPVVAIDLKSVARDPNRVFNKNDSFVQNGNRSNSPSTVTQFRTPVPVKLEVSVGILAGFQLDLEQIASNFIAYFNPYITLAYKVPSNIGPQYDLEVRSKATWNGNLSISTPDVQTHAEKFKRTGDTSFTIDTWIYPEAIDNIKPIYFIDTHFYATKSSVFDYNSLSAQQFFLSSYAPSTQHVDSFYLSGTPGISSIFYSTSGQNLLLESSITFSGPAQRYLLLYGENFSKLEYVMLSASNSSIYPQISTLPSEYYGAVTGYPLSTYRVLNDNMLEVQLPYSPGDGLFNVIVYNAAGWTSSDISFEWRS
jgi:hypothetical protein